MSKRSSASHSRTLAAEVPKLKDDLRQIAAGAGVVAFLLSVLSLGLPAVVAWITEKLGPAVPIWKALVATAPLTMSIALIGVGLVRGKLDGFWQFLAAATIVLVVTAGLARLVGMPGWIDLAAQLDDLPSNPAQLLAAVCFLFLKNYWKIYGAQLFGSSVVVGIFLAWAWGAKILPHVDRLRAARAGEVSQNAQRRAA